MKKVLLPVLLAICTASNLANFGLSRQTANAQPNQTAIKWSLSQLETTKKNCADAMVKALEKRNRKVPMQLVNSYCNCIMRTIAQRYELADFAKNETKYTKQIEKEGKVKECLTIAQAKK